MSGVYVKLRGLSPKNNPLYPKKNSPKISPTGVVYQPPTPGTLTPTPTSLGHGPKQRSDQGHVSSTCDLGASESLIQGRIGKDVGPLLPPNVGPRKMGISRYYKLYRTRGYLWVFSSPRIPRLNTINTIRVHCYGYTQLSLYKFGPPPTQDASHHQDYSIFRSGNPNQNLHL